MKPFEYIAWTLIISGILIGITVCLTGCVNIKSDPNTGMFEIKTFMKNIEADKVSLSVIDAQGNGKTFDMSNYQSSVSEMMLQAYNMGLAVGSEKAQQ